jgi:hypothetical protein
MWRLAARRSESGPPPGRSTKPRRSRSPHTACPADRRATRGAPRPAAPVRIGISSRLLSPYPPAASAPSDRRQGDGRARPSCSPKAGRPPTYADWTGCICRVGPAAPAFRPRWGGRDLRRRPSLRRRSGDAVPVNEQVGSDRAILSAESDRPSCRGGIVAGQREWAIPGRRRSGHPSNPGLLAPGPAHLPCVPSTDRLLLLERDRNAPAPRSPRAERTAAGRSSRMRAGQGSRRERSIEMI